MDGGTDSIDAQCRELARRARRAEISEEDARLQVAQMLLGLGLGKTEAGRWRRRGQYRLLLSGTEEDLSQAAEMFIFERVCYPENFSSHLRLTDLAENSASAVGWARQLMASAIPSLARNQNLPSKREFVSDLSSDEEEAMLKLRGGMGSAPASFGARNDTFQISRTTRPWRQLEDDLDADPAGRLDEALRLFTEHSKRLTGASLRLAQMQALMIGYNLPKPRRPLPEQRAAMLAEYEQDPSIATRTVLARASMSDTTITAPAVVPDSRFLTIFADFGPEALETLCQQAGVAELIMATVLNDYPSPPRDAAMRFRAAIRELADGRALVHVASEMSSAFIALECEPVSARDKTAGVEERRRARLAARGSALEDIAHAASHDRFPLPSDPQELLPMLDTLFFDAFFEATFPTHHQHQERAA